VRERLLCLPVPLPSPTHVPHPASKNIPRSRTISLELDTHTLVVQEYANGGDLYGRIEPTASGPSPATARAWMLQTALALAHVHSKGFVHRDVKPENILLHDGVVRLADFGLAQRTNTTSAGSKVSGTRQYMAPETLAGSHTVCPAQDVWSLGIVLYAMLFADLPWERAREGDVEYEYYCLTRALGPAGMLSAPLTSLMARMLEPDPEQRITLAEVIKFFSDNSQPWFSTDKAVQSRPASLAGLSNTEIEAMFTMLPGTSSARDPKAEMRRVAV
jgi:serine/threonine protein kinase